MRKRRKAEWDKSKRVKIAARKFWTERKVKGVKEQRRKKNKEAQKDNNKEFGEKEGDGKKRNIEKRDMEEMRTEKERVLV
jgi:hypothetical protein